MVLQIAKEDVVRGLRKCKRLAKQDLLASSLTSDPEYWNAQAGARRQVYTELMDMVEGNGVETAYAEAKAKYAALPLLCRENPDPATHGRRSAYEMFFTILGLEASAVRSPAEHDRVVTGLSS